MSKVFIDGPIPLGNPKSFAQAIDDALNGDTFLDINKMDGLPASLQSAMKDMQVQADVFTNGVSILKDSNTVPVPVINSLMKDVWNICNNKIVRCVMLPSNPVTALSFAMAQGKDGKTIAMLMLPIDYAQRYQKDPIFVLGGIVFAGSQVRDFYNGKIGQDNGKEIVARGKMYEAEFLMFAAPHSFNKYQQSLLEMFPKGLATRPELLYDSIETPMPTNGVGSNVSN